MTEKLEEIEIGKIKVIENIRIAEENMHELMESIKQHGLLEPIGVYQKNGEYILKYGFRRLMAHKKLGYHLIQAKVDDNYDESKDKINHLVLNSIENIQREDITAIELGRICYRLKKLGLNEQEIAVRLSKSVGTIKSALATYKRVPEKFRADVAFKSGNILNPKIASTSANLITRMASRGKISKKETVKLFELCKSKELKIIEMQLILNLVRSGLSVDQAIKNYSDYGKTEIKMVFKHNNMEKLIEKYELPKHKIVRAILNGEISNVNAGVIKFYTTT